LRLLGYPITEEFTAVSTDGKSYRQQYFERARMEHHPENGPPNDVLLGLLGVWTTGGRTFPKSTPPTDGGLSVYFEPTGQSVRLFKGWWEQNGGLALFGYPLSGEVQETNAADGKSYTPP
jgi:hypothetical protein